MENSSKALTLRQQRFVAEYVKSGGTSAAAAARVAGYGDAYADGAAKFLLTQPGIKTAIDVARAQVREQTGYDVARCMQDIDAFIEETRKDKSPNRMSIFKAIELRARLAGLLVERVKFEETLNVRGALIEARKRGGVLDRDAVLQQLTAMSSSGLITAADLEQATRDAPVDVEYKMLPRGQVDPFS